MGHMQWLKIAVACCLLASSFALLTVPPKVRDVRLAVPNCPPHPVPLPLPSPLPATIQDALRVMKGELEAVINTTNLPGIAASMVYMGKEIWTQGFGVKNKSGQPEPPDHNTIFRIGSVSKVFAVLALYQMYERGDVKSLDDAFVMYCPDFDIKSTYNSTDITLREMAAQLSGLPREAPCNGSTAGLNICPFTTAEILQRLTNEYTVFPPWTMPSYSNLAYALLGRCLVEHLYPGMTYEEYVQKYILQPLNMSSTGFNYTEAVKSHMATGYMPDGSVAPLYDWGWARPSFQMYSTASDLNKLVHFFTSVVGESGGEPIHPEVLSGDLRKEMELQDMLTGFGTPWEIEYEENYTLLAKGGNVYGYSALMSYIPDLKLGWNVLFSGQVNQLLLAYKVFASIIPGFVDYLMTVQPPYPFPPNPEAYVGDYEANTQGQNISAKVFVDKEQLLFSTMEATTFLSYAEPLRMQIDFPTYIMPCLVVELVAMRHQWVDFDPLDATGKSPGLNLPGLSPGVHFSRA